MPIDLAQIRKYLKAADFRSLFNAALGWDRHDAPLRVHVDGQAFNLRAHAQKRGMVVFTCPAHPRFPDYALRLKIERQVAKSVHEHIIIFTDAPSAGGASHTQVWQWVRREPGKPIACREYASYPGHSVDALAQRVAALAFTLDEEDKLTLPDVTNRTRKALDVERVTKRFYERFTKEHERFLDFIEGITTAGDREWYASIMLNRLMFIYFIQRKTFLDGDPDYLRNRLQRVQQQRGKGKFLSFYRYFLTRLMQEGLGRSKEQRRLDQAFATLLGNVPYLNGGIFEQHQLERAHPDIDIPDEAFESIFDFFDEFDWTLDTRPPEQTRKKPGDKDEINPDVLGYIFEKYINQKQMGAYYTKEDITEYIGKNTVLPFIFDKARTDAKHGCPVAFKPDAALWRLLKDDPDRYIYPAMRQGTLDDDGHEVPLPSEIASGIADVSKRAGWNKPAEPRFALPSETWREHVARRQRCFELRRKLAAGEVTEINDLITLNLDIRQFAQDAIETCEGPEMLRALYHAISTVTILDPTCGSGAFLFAALNILEPLYEACLNRMERFIADAEALSQTMAEGLRGEKSKTLSKAQAVAYGDFRTILAQVGVHSNDRYFIFKSIILGNLFGVDIMEEAVEICRLRLFLKLVAQVEPDSTKPNLGVEPLPDIDFNIRAGNTLVGFASLGEVRKSVEGPKGGTGQFDFGNEVAQIELEAQAINKAYHDYTEIQTLVQHDSARQREKKDKLRQMMRRLSDRLDRHLAGQHGIEAPHAAPSGTSVQNKKALAAEAKFQKWRATHHPFHWVTEFYGIMRDGGFDAIIGNPPYVEIPKDMARPALLACFRTALDKWSRDEDLYTLVVERSLELREAKGRLGLILPLSLAFSTKKPFQTLRSILAALPDACWWSHFDRIPSALFGNEVRTRCTIVICGPSRSAEGPRFTTSLCRWTAERRSGLFPTLCYARLTSNTVGGIPRVATQPQADALAGLELQKRTLADDWKRTIGFPSLADAAPRFPPKCVFVGGTAYNWFPAWRDMPPTTDERGKPSLPARTIGFEFADTETADAAFALLCSSLGYWWWAVASDGFNLKKWLIERFPICLSALAPADRQKLARMGHTLRENLKREYVYKENKGRIGNFYLPACASDIAQIDDLLAEALPHIDRATMQDIREFNQMFSRAEVDDQTEDDGDDK